MRARYGPLKKGPYMALYKSKPQNKVLMTRGGLKRCIVNEIYY